MGMVRPNTHNPAGKAGQCQALSGVISYMVSIVIQLKSVMILDAISYMKSFVINMIHHIFDAPLGSYSWNDALQCQTDSIEPWVFHWKAHTPIGCNQMYAGDHAVRRRYFLLWLHSARTMSTGCPASEGSPTHCKDWILSTPPAWLEAIARLGVQCGMRRQRSPALERDHRSGQHCLSKTAE